MSLLQYIAASSFIAQRPPQDNSKNHGLNGPDIMFGRAQIAIVPPFVPTAAGFWGLKAT